MAGAEITYGLATDPDAIKYGTKPLPAADDGGDTPAPPSNPFNATRTVTADYRTTSLPSFSADGEGPGKTLTLNANGPLVLSNGQPEPAPFSRIMYDPPGQGNNSKHGGIYDYTTQGDGSTQAVLTRSDDFDEDLETVVGTKIDIAQGAFAGLSYELIGGTNDNTITPIDGGLRKILFAPWLTTSPRVSGWLGQAFLGTLGILGKLAVLGATTLRDLTVRTLTVQANLNAASGSVQLGSSVSLQDPDTGDTLTLGPWAPGQFLARDNGNLFKGVDAPSGGGGDEDAGYQYLTANGNIDLSVGHTEVFHGSSDVVVALPDGTRDRQIHTITCAGGSGHSCSITGHFLVENQGDPPRDPGRILIYSSMDVRSSDGAGPFALSGVGSLRARWNEARHVWIPLGVGGLIVVMSPGDEPE